MNGTARRDAWVTLAALVLILAWEAGGADLAVARLYGSAAGFPWREAWWARELLHDGGRRLAWAALLLFALDAARPAARGRPARGERLYWLGVTLGCALLVPAIKRLSATSCPWDLAAFGGTAAYVPHWAPGLPDGGPGHCFPSGHAVAAFAFLGAYFLWRPHRPGRARAALAAVLGFGLLFGWTQVVRGAHFPSHVLWSGWLCWSACALAAWNPTRPGAVVSPFPRDPENQQDEAARKRTLTGRSEPGSCTAPEPAWRRSPTPHCRAGRDRGSPS